MLANLALFSRDAIAKRGVRPPQGGQGIGDRGHRIVDLDFVASRCGYNFETVVRWLIAEGDTDGVGTDYRNEQGNWP